MTEAHLSERSGAKESVSMKAEVFLPDDYRPAEDEPFMNDRQLEYFRRKLLIWKQELLDQSAETIDSCKIAPAMSPTSPTVPPKRRTARWNCGPATVTANWSIKSILRCAVSKKKPMAIATKPATRSA